MSAAEEIISANDKWGAMECPDLLQRDVVPNVEAELNPIELTLAEKELDELTHLLADVKKTADRLYSASTAAD
ncbi:MAG: hypothetical protein ACKO2P_05115 [Planctomycetota bacterium]